MFLSFNVESLTMPRSELLKCFPEGYKREFAMLVFKLSLFMIIDDIIENGTQFQFTVGSHDDSYLCMQRITGRQYAELRQKGAFKEFDPLNTNFSAYRIECHVSSDRKKARNIPIHLDKTRTARIAELANGGKLKAGKVRTYNDYYDALREALPTVPLVDLQRILRFGYSVMKRLFSNGADMSLRYKNSYFQSGDIFKDRTSMVRYVIRKMQIKCRIMYRRFHFLWDGWSYFTLTKFRYDQIKEALERREIIDFGTVILHKCVDDAFTHGYKRLAMLRVPEGNPDTKFTDITRLVTDKAELVEIFPTWYDWPILANREYQTLYKSTVPIQKIYRDNKKQYKTWLRAKRWKDLRR